MDENGMTFLQKPVRIAIGEEPVPGWTITRHLGGGAFGQVWQIERGAGAAKLQEALKVIRIPENPEELLKRELESMAQLRGHPNVVRCDDFFFCTTEQDTGPHRALLIRMELLNPLDKWFDQHPPAVGDVVRMGCEILSALERMKQLNMIHRDIKPANIFCSDYGTFKLGDYGLARTLPAENAGLSWCGTPDYMAPEMDVVDPMRFLLLREARSSFDLTVDYYALALVLYQYLNGGMLPFVRETLGARAAATKMRKNGSVPIPAPSEAGPALSEVILKALSFDPALRYQSPEEFRKALMEASGAGSSEPSRGPAVTAVPLPVNSQNSVLNTMNSMNDHRSRLENSLRTDSAGSADWLDGILGKK